MADWSNIHPCPTGPHLTPEAAGQYLQQVSEASTKIGLGGIKWKHKQWKSYRDVWTPHMLANQAQYHFFLRTQRHLLEQNGYTKWSPLHALPNICNLTFPWEEAIHKAFSGDKDPEAVIRYQNQLRYNPTYYRNLTSAPTREFIAKEIAPLRHSNRTRRAQDRANYATDYRTMLHATYEKKQYGRLIKLLTGDFPPPLDLHDLPGPNDEHLTGPIECLQVASAKFKRHFSRPSEHHCPLHELDADWATALLSWDTFHAKIAHLRIPTYLSNIIWESLTNVPNIQAGHKQLHTVFTQPPTYEDYLLAIKSHRKNTAPGLTGFSYRHLKALPEDLHKATYNMLCSLWPTQHILDYWKQRWLVPLHKTDELISKPALQMAWTRLGVPPEWAQFLIQLDLEGTTTVRPPISQEAHDRHGIAGLRRLQALGADDILLPAERGVPQGDVASPFGWNAVYDILLRALTFQRPTLNDPTAQAIAYADDLLSLSSHLPSLQHQADLVASFAQIFELDLATSKFRAYEFPYHKVHPKQTATTPLTITIQGKTIRFRQQGTLTYLGSQYDLDPANQSQHTHHLLQLYHYLHAVRHRPAQPAVKSMSNSML
jgi:Reverse transcriptase (RNA-dependent DNA polymerase)